MMNRVRIPTFLAGLLLAALPAAAQLPAPPGELVDRVVAVVGDSAVLQTEIEEELLRLAAAGQQLPQDPVALGQLRRQTLQAILNELLLVQAAQKDTTLIVPAEDLEQQVDQQLQQQQRAFGGQAGFERALREQWNMTMAEYRQDLMRSLRRQALAQQYLAKVQRDRRPPPVKEEEIRAFFEANRGQLGQRPATLTFEQVVVSPQPGDSAREAARALAAEVLTKLQSGEDFAPLARRYSQDPGTREAGGDLGWFRRGQMVRAFEDVAFALRPGQVSGIVETPFGFHVIKVEKIRGAERQARHILIRAELEDVDLARARERADSVAAALRAGTPIDSLVERYHDPAEESEIGPFPRERLPDPYGTELAGAATGQVVGPFRLGDAGVAKWAVVRVVEARDAGAYSLDDPIVRERVREQLQQQKLLEEVVGELRRRTYVEIRP